VQKFLVTDFGLWIPQSMQIQTMSNFFQNVIFYKNLLKFAKIGKTSNVKQMSV
jgi:hypothetical protein